MAGIVAASRVGLETWPAWRSGRGSAERAGALVGGREEDLDFLTEVGSAERRIADLWNDDVLPERVCGLAYCGRELGRATRVACGSRRNETA